MSAQLSTCVLNVFGNLSATFLELGSACATFIAQPVCSVNLAATWFLNTG